MTPSAAPFPFALLDVTPWPPRKKITSLWRRRTDACSRRRCCISMEQASCGEFYPNRSRTGNRLGRERGTGTAIEGLGGGTSDESPLIDSTILRGHLHSPDARTKTVTTKPSGAALPWSIWPIAPPLFSSSLRGSNTSRDYSPGLTERAEEPRRHPAPPRCTGWRGPDFRRSLPFGAEQ